MIAAVLVVGRSTTVEAVAAISAMGFLELVSMVFVESDNSLW